MPDIDERVSALERDVVALQTEVRIQFKEVFTRIKRLEDRTYSYIWRNYYYAVNNS